MSSHNILRTELNIDHETGIHFGIIPLNDMSDWMWDTFVNDGEDLNYTFWKDETKNIIKDVIDATNKYVKDSTGAPSADSESNPTPQEYFEEKIKKLAKGYISDSDIDDIVEEYCAQVSFDGYLADSKQFVEEAFDCVQDGYQDNGDGPNIWYDQDGYKVAVRSDCECSVEKSPYYAYAAECSPCAPNAGYLRTEGYMKTYCMGPECFDAASDNDKYARKMPYRCYRVADDVEVTAEQ